MCFCWDAQNDMHRLASCYEAGCSLISERKDDNLLPVFFGETSFSFVNHTRRKSSFEPGEEATRAITPLSSFSSAKKCLSHCFLLFIGKNTERETMYTTVSSEYSERKTNESQTITTLETSQPQQRRLMSEEKNNNKKQ